MKYLIITFTSILLSTSIVWAQVGYIDTLNGPPSAFELIHNGDKLKVSPFKQLYPGDQIRIRKKTNKLFADKENYLTLAFANSQFVTLRYVDTQDSPYRVGKHRNTISILNNIFNLTSQWVSALYLDHVQTLSIQTKGQDNEIATLSMPILTGHEAKLLAGKRQLHLAWQGGKPPYQVSLYRTDQRVPLWVKNALTATTAILEKRDISVGGYQIIVTDAQGKQVIGEFTAVADTTILTAAEIRLLEQSQLSAATKKTLQASWLAHQAGWYWEAYQQVSEIKDYYPAVLVKTGLAAGLYP
jgi:hypothetical protein